MAEPAFPYDLSPPPTVDELVTDDGVPMETQRHRLESELLTGPLELEWSERRDVFVGANMFLYYSLLQQKQNDFRGPDVFVVLDTDRRMRKAWVMWEEGGQHPDVVIELTSSSTKQYDHGEKKRIYAVIGVPEYFLYDPTTAELEGHRLNAGRGTYEPIAPLPTGRLPSERLGLELGIWPGKYHRYEGPWLRWFRPDGTLLPTAEEERQRRVETERQRDEAANQRDEAAKQRDEAAKQRDEAAKQRDEETRRREEVEVRIRELEEKLGRR